MSSKERNRNLHIETKKQTEMEIKRNGLTLIPKGFGFICQELANIPQNFENYFSRDEAESFSLEFLKFIRGSIKGKFATKEETDKHSEQELRELGQQIFDRVIEGLTDQLEGKSLFEKTLFLLGEWWYHHPVFLRETSRDLKAIWEKQHELSRKAILPVLPQSVKVATEGMVLASMSVNFGHFALLFCDNEKNIRRIVTDTQLYELHGVFGYSYLDIDFDGKPIARSRCNLHGGRAFFDGVRLMSHGQFQTCAPKTILIKGGYKVNSTRCTIVSGQLFDLIDVEDAVAQTTGAFMGWCDFTSNQMADATDLAESSGKQMWIEGDDVHLNNEILQPIGVFLPSSIHLLDNGFTLFDWSEFHEIESVRYKSVLVVDDNQSWIDSVVAEFGGEVKELTSFQTHSADDALAKILEVNPGAVVLDIHLTDQERFDGLWVANQLAVKGFGGVIMVASSYGDEALKSMQCLIKTPTIATGKNLGRIRNVLYGKG